MGINYYSILLFCRCFDGGIIDDRRRPIAQMEIKLDLRKSREMREEFCQPLYYLFA